MKQKQVVIADRSPIFRAAARCLVERERDLAVTEAATLDDLLAAPADVAVVELDLPPRGGLEAVERLTRELGTAAIVWSFAPTGEAVLAALQSGACGYLRKDVSPGDLIDGLRAALRGDAVLAPDLAVLLAASLRRRGLGERARRRAEILSLRERTVLELVAAGRTNREIAASLSISEFTVKRHVQNILRKLETPSRHAAAAFLRSLTEAGGWSAAVGEAV